jgi:adenylate cyclase
MRTVSSCSVIEKTRHIVPSAGSTCEAGVFAGESAGLVIAEIELRDDDQELVRPSWLGAEITGDARYGNSALARRPFDAWADAEGDSRAPALEPV